MTWSGLSTTKALGRDRRDRLGHAHGPRTSSRAHTPRLGVLPDLRSLLRPLTLDLLIWVRTEVYSPIPMEKAPAISPGETGEHDETRSRTGGADTSDEREVGHQAVHRSEDRGTQRAAGSGCGQSP